MSENILGKLIVTSYEALYKRKYHKNVFVYYFSTTLYGGGFYIRKDVDKLKKNLWRNI